MTEFKERCKNFGGEVAGNFCVIEGAGALVITNFKEKRIELPNNVQTLFFRLPREIKVERRMDKGTNIGTFEEMSKRYYWD